LSLADGINSVKRQLSDHPKYRQYVQLNVSKAKWEEKLDLAYIELMKAAKKTNPTLVVPSLKSTVERNATRLTRGFSINSLRIVNKQNPNQAITQALAEFDKLVQVRSKLDSKLDTIERQMRTDGFQFAGPIKIPGWLAPPEPKQ
jgi:hypothetical protein